MNYLVLLLAILPLQAFACEDMPSPENTLAAIKKPYATIKDYEQIKYALDGTFEQADINHDGKLTLAEMHKNQEDYQTHCLKIQDGEI